MAKDRHKKVLRFASFIFIYIVNATLFVNDNDFVCLLISIPRWRSTQNISENIDKILEES